MEAPEPRFSEILGKMGEALVLQLNRTLAPALEIGKLFLTALFDRFGSIASEPAQPTSTGWFTDRQHTTWQVSWSQAAFLALALVFSILFLLLKDQIVAALLSLALRRCTGRIKKHQVRTSFWRGERRS
jgi:hypothetical protein